MELNSKQEMVNTDKNSSGISPKLWNLYNSSLDGSLSDSYQNIITDENGTSVLVRVTGRDIDALVPYLEDIGFQSLGTSPEKYLVEGFVPIGAIPDMESLTSHGLMGAIALPKPRTRAGLVTSQADIISETQRVRDALPDGFDGTGVRIGVMSDSFDISGNGSEAEDIASGDLPPEGVAILRELPFAGIDEGRAMSQLIYDLAPGASQVFASVSLNETIVAQQIRDLADPNLGNADILVDNIGFPTEPFYQDGIISQAIDEVVTQEGVTYFSAAGNDGDTAYESTNFDAAPDSDGLFEGRQFHDFDPGDGVDTRQSITILWEDLVNLGGIVNFALQWDDPFYTTDGVDTDLNFWLVEAGTTNVLFSSEENNIANQIPFEQLLFENTKSSDIEAEVLIELVEGPEPERFKYINAFGGGVEINEFGPNSSAIFGHPAAVNGKAVGAVDFFNQDEPAGFTSVGPVTILFNPDGTRKETPEVRQAPDFAAIQGTDTTFFGGINDIEGDGNNFPNFFGTSAAAPHAAAIAALIKQANPDFTPQEIYERLESTATDIGEPGIDNQSGAGLINAYDALFGSPEAAEIDFVEDFEDGDLPIVFETNTTGAGRIQVTEENGPIGTQHITLDSSFDDTFSLNELILNVDATDKSDVVLSFDQKEFDDRDTVMSETFTGSENSDGVALSVDGENWFRLFDLRGENSTNEYQNKTINLSDFAEEKGLILGENVAIKFQQYGDESIASRDGFALDNISVTGTSIVDGTSNDDNLIGSAGKDVISGLNGQDRLNGLAGDDELDGGNGNDSLFSGAGNDTLIGGSGQDELFGGSNDDDLDGGDGDDLLNGGAGNNSLIGGFGNDTLVGGSGQNELFGGEGNDFFIGGSGENFATGGTGKDEFLLLTPNPLTNIDFQITVTDFQVGQDLIVLVIDILTFDSLEFVSQNGGTLITTTDNQELAFFENVDSDLINNEDNFISVAFEEIAV